jgi:serine/threonine protein kinase/tetratricopeptide (TPR) repeat protein
VTCPDTDTLAAIDTLGDAERAAIVDHAATCDDCRAVLIALVDDSSSRPTLSVEIADPETIDRFQIQRRIGAGAMGVVFAAFDPELARPVAIKVLRAGGSPERMKREAQALARLTHGNVVAVYDVGEHEGATFVAMALVDGENLRTWLRGEPSTEQIIDAIVQVTRGVDAAHRAGIIHRDLKPDNIFVARTGEVLVGDFGLARTAVGEIERVDKSTTSSELTRTGTAIGTPAYMAPEQLEGEASAASDQFALCVTAWEALYGARPFTGKTVGELATAVAKGPPPEPSTRSVPAHVRAAIRKGLAAAPSDRHASLGAMLAAFTPPRRHVWPFIVVGLGLAAASAALVMRSTTSPQTDAIARCDMAPAGDLIARRVSSLAKLSAPDVKPAGRDLVRTLVDRYLTRSRELRRTSCIANARREVSDPVYATTVRCLDRRDATLWWAIESTPSVTDTMSLVESLEPIETCEGLTAAAAPSPELAALQQKLDRLGTQVIVAPEKLAGLEQLVEMGTRFSDPDVQAELGYLEGMYSFDRGNAPAATKALSRALTFAEQARDDRLRTRISAQLAVVAARRGRLVDAELHAATARSAVGRVSDPRSLVAVESANVAIAYARANVPTELDALRRIERLQIEHVGDPSRAIVATRLAIASALARGSAPDAKAANDKALATQALLFDASGLDAIEQELQGITQPADRIALSRVAVTRARAEKPSEVPAMLMTLSYDLELVGDYEAALQASREALQVQRTLPANDVNEEHRALLWENIIAFSFETAEQTDDRLLQEKRLAETIAALDEGPAEIRESEFGRSTRGRTLILQGKYAEAVPLMTEALRLAERAEKPVPFRILVRELYLARALWETGGAKDRERAKALVDQAASRVPAAREELAKPGYGRKIDLLERVAIQIDTWRKQHR